jgi:hypothetical protein
MPVGRPSTPDEWAMEAFALAKQNAYGNPPLAKTPPHKAPSHLDAAYVTQADKDAALQSSKAGVRLASILKKALGSK